MIHAIATTGECFSSRLPKQGGLGGAEGPQILSSSYYVYKQLPQKDVQNSGKQERKKQLSAYKLASFPEHSQILSHRRHREIWGWPGNEASYKQCYTYKNQSLKCISRLSLCTTNSILEAKPPSLLKSCLHPCFHIVTEDYHSMIHSVELSHEHTIFKSIIYHTFTMHVKV